MRTMLYNYSYHDPQKQQLESLERDLEARDLQLVTLTSAASQSQAELQQVKAALEAQRLANEEMEDRVGL